MKKMKLKLISGKKVMLYTFLVSFLLLCVASAIKLLTFTSLGADTTTVTAEVNLEKYMNYNLSEQDNGTLVQYKIKTKVEYGKEFLPITRSETVVNLGEIDGKYPKEVKVIEKSALETTNQYDASTGTLLIQSNNQDENGELIQKEQLGEESSDSYVVICYYDTYTTENSERELEANVLAKATLSNEEGTQISDEKQCRNLVTENVGKLTSIHCETQDIYNGYLKSNIANGTKYTTPYEQMEQIVVSKKEAQDKIEILENNTFIETQQNTEIGNNKNLVYKSTEIAKADIERLLGEEGRIEILDIDENLIVTIDKNTEFDENGVFLLTYESEPEGIIIRTSDIVNEGILNVKHKKEIKNTMTQIQNVSVKTTLQMNGMENVKQLWQNNYEIIQELKEAETKVDINVDNANWSNNQQNKVTFDIYLDASNIKNNLFNNPSFRIELPSQVEKVIVENSSILYANGLELQTPYLETNENGNLVIAVNLIGGQTEYSENTLELVTDVKIVATVILNKNIESTTEKVKLNYTNQYTLDGSRETGNKEVPVQLESFEKATTVAQSVMMYEEAKTTSENNIKLEVSPVKGDTVIANGDTLYEGEYIKYNIKVSNLSDETIDNIKIVGNVPEGTVYGELEADYYTYDGKYQYNFDDTIEFKSISVGSLEAGKEYNTFYELRVNDLSDGQTERQTITNIKAYVGEVETSIYELTNIIKPAEVKVELASILGQGDGERWVYKLNLVSDEEKEVTVKVALPSEMELDAFVHNGERISLDTLEISKDNVVTTTLNTNSGQYFFIGDVYDFKFDRETTNSKAELIAVATVIANNTYKSNENRIVYEYENISITMTSSNEGEELKYEEEIDYQIIIKKIGKTNINDTPINVNLKDFLPENINPVMITYENWEQEGETDIYNKVQNSKDISYIEESVENGSRLPNVDLFLNIPFGESVTIDIKATAGFVYEKTMVENSATAAYTNREIKFIENTEERKTTVKSSNTIIHTILPYNYDEINEEDKPDNPDDPNTPDDPNIPNDPNTPDTSEKYSIFGVAWKDENEDGERQTSEELLSGINVMLIDAKNSNIVRNNVQTDSEGKYTFSELEKGNYIVLFQYDTDTYQITEYQKSNVSSNLNCDASNRNITIQGKQLLLGATDIISLDCTKYNIDIGLFRNKICDLKLEKYITKVVVSTSNGTKQYAYDNEKLAKVEIKAKEIQEATIVVEYKLVVTNQGEIPTSVSKVIDTLPEGLTFSSELNKDWTMQTNGKLINTSISNQKIQVGKSLELALTLTKKMNSNAIGSFTNIAEVGEMTNSLNVSDINIANNSSKAELIISISTGMIAYLSIGTIILVLAGVGFYLIFKFDILRRNKLGLFVLVIITVITMGGTRVEAEVLMPSRAEFAWDKEGKMGYSNDAGSTYFYGRDQTGPALCTQYGVKASSNWTTYNYNGYTKTKSKTYVTKTPSTDMTLKKTNNNIDVMMIEKSDYYIFGPFDFESNVTSGYTCYMYDCDGEAITGGFTTCDQNGNNITITTKDEKGTFYIKIPTNQCTKGVSKVDLEAKRDREVKTTTEEWGKAKYNHSKYQNVETINEKLISKTSTTKEVQEKEIITWGIDRGTIEIKKIDKDDSTVALEGVKIRVTCSDNGYDKTFTTDSEGKIFVDSLKTGTYSLTEIYTPYYGYTASATGSVTVIKGKTESVTLTNEKRTGNLKINKKDVNSGSPLKDVSFKIKASNGQYIIADSYGQQSEVIGYVYLTDLAYTTDVNKATEFVTDSNGGIGIYNLLIDTYQVIETSVGKNTEYEVDDDYISWESNNSANSGVGRDATVTVNRQTSDKTSYDKQLFWGYRDELIVKNKKIYINLSGIVWLDNIDKTKGAERNGIYKKNNSEQDLLLQGITVQLIHSSDATKNKAKTTDSNGFYNFEKVVIDELKNYEIKFSYNGMSYEPVTARTDLTNGSKAIELKTDRTNFNNNYATITKGKSNAYNLTYKTSEYKSELLYRSDRNEAQYNYGNNSYKEGRGPVTGVDPQYMIGASTRNAYNGALNQIVSEDTIRKNGMTEIRNINLGLQTREQPDITIVKDLYRVKVKVNGQTHIYNYGDRFNASLYEKYNDEGKSGYDMSPQVKFGSKYGSMSYTRALYASDIKYEGQGSLEVYVTYRIGVRNNSDTLKLIVNEIVDYMDSKYNFVSAGKDIDEDGNMKGKKLEDKEESSGNSQYKKRRIQTNLEVANQKEESIYIQLQVKPDKIVEILGNNNQVMKLDNIAEVSSYSTKDASGNAYAGIDRDSQPDSIELTDIKTYEDDTDKASGLKLVLQEERKVSGQVFEDVTDDTFKSGEIRQGDGKLTGQDQGIAGVTVKLVNAQTGETAKAYNGENWVDAVTTTGNNGEYTLGGFIPDNYKIVYTWGDSNYKVQDYKGTIVNKTTYNAKSGNLEWYNDEFKKNYPNVEWNQSENNEIRVSDAIDDYAIRQNIDKQTNMMTNANKAVINNYSGQIQQKDGTTQTLITKMDSTTPTFRVNIEYSTAASDAKEEYKLDDSGEVVMNGIYAVKQQGKENYLRSIDFGIVERARQVLSLDKQVKSTKIILANGSVLINANVVKEEATGKMKLEDKVKHTVYIPNSAGANGQVKIELDNEIIQGAKLEIEYVIQVSNISELEYLNQEYYLYGRGYGQNNSDLVTLKASDVIDYLDNNITIDMEGNKVGKVIQDNTEKTVLIQQGLLENTSLMQKLLKETTRVIQINQLSKELKPIGDTQTEISLKTNKLLSNTSGEEEATFDNDAEIIRIEKTGGSSLITTPGNYIPSSTLSEYDNDKAESVSIVPPTGLATDYIAYTILAISSLGILIAGIILIKKFVLK